MAIRFSTAGRPVAESARMRICVGALWALFLVGLASCASAGGAKQVAPAGTKPSLELAVSGQPNAGWRATSEGGPVTLFGPFELSDALRAWEGPLHVYLENLTFAEGGNSALFYLVDVSGRPAGEVKVDETNYISSAANVSGMGRGPMDHPLPVNDYELEGVKHQPRTRLRSARSVMLAMVVTRGALTFERAVLSTREISDREKTVVFYDVPAQGKTAATAAFPKAKVTLHGPLELSSALRETDEILYLVLEGVTFPPETPVNALIYLVEGGTPGATVEIDPTNYVTGIGNVAGMSTGPLRVLNTIHDYEVNGTPHLPRTRLKTMKSPMIAIAITDGDLKFGRAMITTRKPQ